MRALTPTSGQILFQKNGSTVDLAALSDRELKPLRTQMQMIFQDPFSSLNPRITVGDIVVEPLTVHRMAYGSDREDRVADMLTKVGLRVEHMHRYPHAFSGGQRQRIGIARALIMKPGRAPRRRGGTPRALRGARHGQPLQLGIHEESKTV